MRLPRHDGILLLPLLASAACGGSPSPAPVAPKTDARLTSAEAPSTPVAVSASPKAKPALQREPESVVNLAFEPLATGVRPGGKVVLAAHFRIAPGYRISWKTAGEVGSPTTVAFRAPPGFEVGNVEFPAPERYTAPGGYGGLGYEKETVVFVEVKAPPGLRRDAVSRFDLDASWVACKGTCASERTSAFVELTTTYGNARVREIEAAVAPFRARVPKPLDSLKGSDVIWESGPRVATLVVKLPGATPRDFISDGSADPKPEKTSIADGELRFVYKDAPRPGSRPLRGVIVAAVGGAEAFYELEAPLPEEEANAEKVPKKRRASYTKKSGRRSLPGVHE